MSSSFTYRSRRPLDMETLLEMALLPYLTLDDLKREAHDFAARESAHHEPLLFGVTDGKAIGTYFEQRHPAHSVRSGHDNKQAN